MPDHEDITADNFLEKLDTGVIVCKLAKLIEEKCELDIEERVNGKLNGNNHVDYRNMVSSLIPGSPPQSVHLNLKKNELNQKNKNSIKEEEDDDDEDEVNHERIRRNGKDVQDEHKKDSTKETAKKVRKLNALLNILMMKHEGSTKTRIDK